MKWPLLILLTFAMLKGFSQGDSQRMETKHPYAPMNPSGSRYYPELHYTDENGNKGMPYHRRRCEPVAGTLDVIIFVSPLWGSFTARPISYTGLHTVPMIYHPFGVGEITLRMDGTLFQNCFINADTTQRT